MFDFVQKKIVASVNVAPALVIIIKLLGLVLVPKTLTIKPLVLDLVPNNNAPRA